MYYKNHREVIVIFVWHCFFGKLLPCAGISGEVEGNDSELMSVTSTSLIYWHFVWKYVWYNCVVYIWLSVPTGIHSGRNVAHKHYCSVSSDVWGLGPEISNSDFGRALLRSLEHMLYQQGHDKNKCVVDNIDIMRHHSVSPVYTLKFSAVSQ